MAMKRGHGRLSSVWKGSWGREEGGEAVDERVFYKYQYVRTM